MRSSTVPVALFTAALIATGLLRSASADGQAQGASPLFAVKSELVVLNVSVKDKHRHYLDGLQQDAFSIFEDGEARPVQFFLNEESPVTIGLLIDNSGSMQPNRDLVIAAITAFARTSKPQDDIFALAFNEEVRAALPAESPFTNDPGILRTAVERAVTTRGRTALYDAIARGLEYVERGRYDRKVLVIVSDGSDNASALRYQDALDKIQGSNVLVYAVALTDPVDVANPKQLRELATVSGGEAFRPDSVRKVNDALQRVAQEIRHTYVLAFEPSDAARANGLRRIRVAVRSPDNQKVEVRARTGYMSGSGDEPQLDAHER